MASEKYLRYLDSKEWEEKREKRLKIDGYLCRKCKKRKATQVHHKTYIRIYREHMNDLMSVCATCHAKIHGKPAPSKRKRGYGKKRRKGAKLGNMLAKVMWQ